MKKVTTIAILLYSAMLSGCTAGAESVQTTAATTEEQPIQTGEQTVYRTIAPENAKELIGTDGVVLLDVRTQEEFDEAHIEDAVLVPYDAIAANLDKLPDDMDTTIIVYCRSGRRSAIAANELIGMGYTQVYDLGGIQDWPYGTVTS